MKNFQPVILLDYNTRPYLVYAKGRIHYRAVSAANEALIKLVKLDDIRFMRQAMYKGQPYPPKRAASFWLNHATRPISDGAKVVLKHFVQRKQGEQS